MFQRPLPLQVQPELEDERDMEALETAEESLRSLSTEERVSGEGDRRENALVDGGA
jgi:hypothetical protein